METNAQRMLVRHTATDAAIERLNDPALQMDPLDHSRNTRSLLNVVRERVLARSLPTAEAELEYQHMSESQVDEIARVFRRAMEPEPNQRLHRTGFPRHASCCRTWRATGTGPVRRVVRTTRTDMRHLARRSPAPRRSAGHAGSAEQFVSVSYTHLTLPTTGLVRSRWLP